MNIQANRTLGGTGACFTLIGAFSGVSARFLQYRYHNPKPKLSTASQTQITATILTYLATFLVVIGFVSLINVMFNEGV